MYQSEEPLSSFFKALLYSAKNAGYKIVVTLLAREADSEEMYSDIIKHWTSLHDVTGEHILFVLNANERKSKFSEYNKLLYGKGGTAYKNENIAFASNKYLKSSFRERELMEGHIEPKNNLKKSHSMEISSLKDTFQLREKDIPSLLIFILDSDALLNPSMIIPLSEISSIYKYLKNMNENLEDLFIEIESRNKEYMTYSSKLKSLQKTSKPKKFSYHSFNYLRKVESNPIVKKNAEKIYKECKEHGSREKCFKYFNIAKQEVDSNTDLIKKLQSIIDKTFFIPTKDWKNKQLEITDLEINIQSIQEEKKIIWMHIFNEIESLSKNKRVFASAENNLIKDVFISYASEDSSIITLLIKVLKQNNISYWLDQEEISWGDSLTDTISDGLKKSQYVLVVLSEAFISSRWTKVELNTMLNIEISKGNKKVLPLIVGDEEKIIEVLPLLRDKRHLVWDKNPHKVVNELSKVLGR